MKKIIPALFVFIALNSVAQTEISGKYDHIGRFENGVAIVKLYGKFGAINSEGKEIIKPEYDKISMFGADGIAVVHKIGLIGLINSQGKVIAEPVYEHIGMFHGGKAVVRKNFKEGVIDNNGKLLVEPKYEKLKLEENGLVRATQNGQQSLLKLDNN